MADMLCPADGFTLAHGFVGVLLARFRLTRYLFYPVPVAWEIYQYFFHYQPHGDTLAYIWLNSLVDILVCVCAYEAASKYLNKFGQYPLGIKINSNARIVTSYLVVTLALTWLFWDDYIRGNYLEFVPLLRIPLILGSFSPLFAAIVVHRWMVIPQKENIKSIGWRGDTGLVYLAFGLVPSLIILLAVFYFGVRTFN